MARKNKSHKTNITISLPAHVIQEFDTHLELLKADGVRKSRSEYFCDLLAEKLGIDRATYVYHAAVQKKPRSVVPLDIDPMVEDPNTGQLIKTSLLIRKRYMNYLDLVYIGKVKKEDLQCFFDDPNNGIVIHWFNAFGTTPPLDKWQQEFIEANPGVDLTGALEDAKLKIKKAGE